MDNAKNLFKQFKDRRYSMIVQMIKDRQEEHLFLEFKQNKKTYTTDSGFVITYVPESQSPPTRALLGRLNSYYTRAGDSFIMMEHHLLEDAFGRRQRPDLDIYYRIVDSSTDTLVIGIKNSGKYIATYPGIKIKMSCDLVLSPYGVDGNNQWNLRPIGQTHGLRREEGVFL